MMTRRNGRVMSLACLAIVGAAGLAAAWSIAGARQPAQAGGASSAKATAAKGGGQGGARLDTQEGLPIRQITLYRSGVASFERRGLVQDDAKIQLRFRTEQINDILKSMVVLDLAGGEVSGISYGSKEPLARRLASFGVNISGNPSMQELLEQLRGSRATVSVADGQISGVIVGVELRQEAQGQAQQPIAVPYLNMLTGAGLRSINLRSITNVVLDDKDLQEELSKALGALAEYRADRSKTVDVNLRGNGSREIVVAYVAETPVWKTSYRLVLADKVKGADGKETDSGKPTLHGWAIVENTTDEDWSNVGLALVSGRPVSFQMDLYEPLYLGRPTVPVPTIPGVMPRSYEAEQLQFGIEVGGGGGAVGYADAAGRSSKSVEDKAEMLGAARMAGKPSGGNRRELAKDMAPGAPAPMSAGEMNQYMARSQAQGAEAGEIFNFKLNNPVTIERQRSAMLPIISSAIDGRRVSIFNRNDGATHPMRGIEMVNATNLQLLPGPISVFDGGAYAGDAQIGQVPPGDKRLLAYAVDLDVEAKVEDTGSGTINRVRIVDGVFEQSTTSRQRATYSFTNKDQARARTVIVEHQRNEGWDLVEPKGAKPETTANLYRFELTVAAGKAGAIAITQEHIDYSRIGLFDYDFPALVKLQQEGKVSQAVIDAVREAGRKRGLVTDMQKKIAALEQEKTGIDADQARIRQNLSTVPNSSQLYTNYLKKLSDQETRLDAIAGELTQARADAQRLQGELDAYIRSLKVD